MSSDDATGRSSPEPHHEESPRLRLLMRDDENRRLLEEWLGERYDVTAGSDADVLEGEFDCCLIDEASFARHADVLAACKERAAPTFLPYLLFRERDGPVDERLWEHVDDVVTVPIERSVLRGRLQGLLLQREFSRTLAAREERFRRIVRTIPDPILIVDPGGTVVETNPAFREYTGTGEGTLAGTALADVAAFPIDAAATLTDLVAAAGAGEPPASGDTTIRYRTPDGTVRSAEVGVASLPDPDGTGSQILFVLRDVTDRIDRERALERERERLDQFASMLAHEVRNPLTVAQGYLERWEITGDADDLDRVRAAHERIESMVSELLAHARGEVAREVQPVALAETVRSAWDATPTKGATLDLAVGEAVVEADPGSLRTALQTLFRNAVEHGGEDVAVRVGILEDGFSVADDGPGIPPADRERVFERGFTTNAAATGLGLALVEQIADAHGWDLRIAEDETGGARFEFVVGSRPDDA